MFSVAVDLLHGTFRGDPDGVANTGRMQHGEWPPSPARLFAAFVAADGTRKNCRVTRESKGAELKWLESLSAPAIRAVPCSHASHQPLQPRYVVKHKGAAEGESHQEYIRRSGVLVRPGVRVAPRDPRVIYEWPGEPEPTAGMLAALRLRAARIGYLGTSDSPVRVTVMSGQRLAGPEDVFMPARDGDQTIAVTGAGDLEVLDWLYDEWCAHGASISRAQFPALRHGAAYRAPGQPLAADRGGVVQWLMLETPISGRRIAAVTDLFKRAVLKTYQDMYGEPPSILHGHGFGETGYELARYLALPDVGFRWSRGRLHGLALWLPPGTDSTDRRRIGDAAMAIRRLTGRGGVDVPVAPRDEADHIRARNPNRWHRRSRRWGTAVPAIHERRRPLDLAELARWCRHADLPEPAGFRASRTPFLSGALDLAPVEVNRPGRSGGRPYSHLELHFHEPVSGPVVIGAGRQRGFGLCAPIQDDAS